MNTYFVNTSSIFKTVYMRRYTTLITLEEGIQSKPERHNGKVIRIFFSRIIHQLPKIDINMNISSKVILRLNDCQSSKIFITSFILIITVTSVRRMHITLYCVFRTIYSINKAAAMLLLLR